MQVWLPHPFLLGFPLYYYMHVLTYDTVEDHLGYVCWTSLQQAFRRPADLVVSIL